MPTRTFVLQIIGALVPILAAVLLKTDRRIVRRLLDVGATSPQRAVMLRVPGPIGLMRLRRLTGAGAIVETAPGYYFLAEPEWDAYRTRRRLRALAIVAIVVPAVLFLIWWLD